MDKHIQQQQQQQQETEFTIISLDESFFFYDSLVRRVVWIDENKRPIVRVTGSHKHSCVFGAMRIEGKQVFRQYNKFNGDIFFEFLKKIHAKFPKCYLFMDKASPHYKSKKVIKYFEQHKDIHTSIPSKCIKSPEFMVMDEIWSMAKRDLIILKYYQSFADLKNKIYLYFRTKRFHLNMRNYLLRDAI
ncbi:MAG: transposase [Candidatus Nitrosocosmicus sp.]